jgi:hypothetical protein
MKHFSAEKARLIFTFFERLQNRISAYIVVGPIYQPLSRFYLNCQRGVANSNRNAGVDFDGERFHIPCQDIKFPRSFYMKGISDILAITKNYSFIEVI